MNANSIVGAEAGGHRLRARRLGVDTQFEAVVFMHKECSVCRSEGFTAHTRILLRAGEQHVLATLYQITTDLIAHDEAALSESAWMRLGLQDGETITAAHPEQVESLSHVRSRIYGNPLNEDALESIITDIVDGKYSDIHLSSFVTACATRPLDRREVLFLTKAMVDAGERLSWNVGTIVDKHSVGGLPGNRTTPIIVSIVAALGLIMPKTSSRAITSPAGTADTMETMAPVDLDTADIHRVVEQEGGCIVWGGGVKLSPADDIIIRIERALDIDSEGQLIASVLSKKIAAGSTHLVLDLPVGPTAKVRTSESAEALSAGLLAVADAFGMRARAIIGDGRQPIGRDPAHHLKGEGLSALRFGRTWDALIRDGLVHGLGHLHGRAGPIRGRRLLPIHLHARYGRSTIVHLRRGPASMAQHQCKRSSKTKRRSGHHSCNALTVTHGGLLPGSTHQKVTTVTGESWSLR